MATSFRPANEPIPTPEVKVEEMTTPTTPKPTSTSESQPAAGAAGASADDAVTPTRASFTQGLAAQKPLPSSPFPQAVQVPEAATETPQSEIPKRQGSQRSRKSGGDSEDVEMEDSDGNNEAGEDGATGAGNSDADSTAAERSGKKKKSQRFYCTDYPPCNLSFTRSEHLARHIRKHTGERPFMCHCGRRFSRLDNLRQHAQTVHVNEDIPVDSLAASGSRYQRQMRTERRQPGGRARASTTSGPLGGPVRGHSKSLSTSSITSIGSVPSQLSAYDDFHRRPGPLVMSNHGPRLSTDSYRSVADSTSSYRPGSPSEFSAPTSATLSTNQSSPRWSCVASPASGHSRTQSLYVPHRERRLSVPSPSPYHGQYGAQPPPGTSMQPSSNHLAPPQGDNWHSRSSSQTSVDDGYRRRTWHPDSRQLTAPTNNLDSVVNSAQYINEPPAPLAVLNQKPQTNIRLPGIETFDPLIERQSPPRRAPSPMVMDTEMTGQPHHDDHNERRTLPHWDTVQRDLNRLDISKHSITPPRDPGRQWQPERGMQEQGQREQGRLNPPAVRFEGPPAPGPSYAGANAASRALHQHTLSAPSMSTPRESKRYGWYHGPPSHVDEVRAARVNRMVHPNISSWSGFPKPEATAEQPPPPPRVQAVAPRPAEHHHGHREDGPGSTGRLGGLDALVAVAALEGAPGSHGPGRPF